MISHLHGLLGNLAISMGDLAEKYFCGLMLAGSARKSSNVCLTIGQQILAYRFPVLQQLGSRLDRPMVVATSIARILVRKMPRATMLLHRLYEWSEGKLRAGKTTRSSMETIKKSTKAQAGAYREIEDGCARAISVCCSMLDAAGVIGASAELERALDAILNLHATSALSVGTSFEPLHLQHGLH